MTEAEPELTEPVDTSALDSAQEAIDEGHDAARKALGDDAPTSELEVPGAGGDVDPGDPEVTPRPS